VVVADDSEHLLKVFQRTAGTMVDSNGRKGSGPGEFQGIWSLQTTSFTGSTVRVWGYDQSQMRLVGYELSDAGQLTFVPRQVVLQSTGNPTAAQWITENVIAAVGLFHEGRVILFDTGGRVLKAQGEIPLVEPRFPPFAAQQALQPTLFVHPDGGMLAVASRFAGRVDIYSTKDGAMRAARVPVPFSPPKTTAQRGTLTIFVSDQQTRFGYVAISGTRQRVYALFSGRTRAGSPGRAYEGSQVHVFDWDGNLVGSLELEGGAVSLAADETDSSIYVLVQDPMPAVMVYDVRHITRREIVDTPLVRMIPGGETTSWLGPMRTLGWAVIWSMYMVRSVRVRNTFVR
jgi:hypothetical protein